MNARRHYYNLVLNETPPLTGYSLESEDYGTSEGKIQ